MRQIFRKNSFPKAPGGKLYQWEDARVSFNVPEDGLYCIEIIAGAKSATQVPTGDDDDLRALLDGYAIGKYEIHEGKVSYMGFGIAGSWDGNSLFGEEKTVYIFVYLNKGTHKLEFYADGKPILKSVKVSQMQSGETFSLKNIRPKKVNVPSAGIPIIGLVFLGFFPKVVRTKAKCWSAKQKGEVDADDVREVVNGNFVLNETAQLSKKLKHSFFAGEQMKGDAIELPLSWENFNAFENSVEIQVDQTPVIASIEVEFFKNIKEQRSITNIRHFRTEWYIAWIIAAIIYLAWNGEKYSASLLSKALLKNGNKKVYGYRTELSRLVSQDPAYQIVKQLIKNELKNGILSGDIQLGGSPKTTVSLESFHLKRSIHGVKRLNFSATKHTTSSYNVKISLLDIYDFDPKRYRDVAFVTGWPSTFIINTANQSEWLDVLVNYEIEIQLLEIISVK